MDARTTLKMLLGIEDDSRDALLSFLIEDAQNMILGYCRITVMPRPLESLVPVIACEMYKRRGYGSTDKAVRSVSEGERSVTYADDVSEAEIMQTYYERLNPFVCRKGRVPSDVKSV